MNDEILNLKFKKLSYDVAMLVPFMFIISGAVLIAMDIFIEAAIVSIFGLFMYIHTLNQIKKTNKEIDDLRMLDHEQ